MKTIKFTPLRRIKKTGKLTVASYMQWRKVKTADYFEFNLELVKLGCIDKNERIYNHKGELLFWFNHNDPESLPLNYPPQEMIDFLLENSEADYARIMEVASEPIGQGFYYSVQGFDCDGVPNFSHYDMNHCSQYNDVTKFEILTAGTVMKWYGLFIYNLKNANINIRPNTIFL